MPIDMPNEASSAQLLRRFLRDLGRHHDTAVAHVDPVTFDAVRLVRLPGTTNRKGPDEPDRPTRRTAILEVSNEHDSNVREKNSRLIASVSQKRSNSGQARRSRRRQQCDPAQALEELVARVASAAADDRIKVLSDSGYALGRFVGQGDLDRAEVEQRLRQAVSDWGLDDSEIYATIARAIDDGVQDAEDNPGGAGGTLPMATQLVNMALASGAELFHTPRGEPYGAIKIGKRVEVLALNSSAFETWLGGRFYQQTEITPAAQAVSNATRSLKFQALFTAPEQEVHVRVGGAVERWFLDLNDDEGRAVEITGEGWRVIKEPPVRFVRPPGSLSLPEPVRGGNVRELAKFINLTELESTLLLLVAWLVGALCPEGPYAILLLIGEPGTGKSLLARLIQLLIDPWQAWQASLLSEPRDVRELMIVARNRHVLAFDNLSGLLKTISNAICRLATGGGHSVRQLFTDTDEVIFDIKRPVILNGVEDFATASDLLDRCITLRLPVIPPEHRRTEREILRLFEEARPRILGALLNIAVESIKNLPQVRLQRMPRMADFAERIYAGIPAAGWTGEQFLEEFERVSAEASCVALEASVIFDVLERYTAVRSCFQGTMAELLVELNRFAGDQVARLREWPKTASALGSALRKLAKDLRSRGYTVNELRTSRSRLFHIGRENAQGASCPPGFTPVGVDPTSPPSLG
jgi:hypothetical protein